MRPRCLAPLLLITMAPFFACTYKAEPTNGKQFCAFGPKQCPDGYECSDGLCYHKGQLPSPGLGGAGDVLPGAGGVGGMGGTGGIVVPFTIPTGGVVVPITIPTGGIVVPITIPTGGIPTKVSTGGSTFHTSSVRLDGSVGPLGGSIGNKIDAGGTHTATFQSGEANGPITGWGWIAMAPLDQVTDPTCGPYWTLITPATPCTDVTNWNSPNALCVSGYIPALPAVPTAEDYNNNWGIQIGVSATTMPGAPIGTAYSSISASVSGALPSGFRLMLHRAGDPDATSYCYDRLSSGTQVLLTRFNTACWDNSGLAFLAADAPRIDKVSLQVSSTATAITLNNMCLNSITFGD